MNWKQKSKIVNAMQDEKSLQQRKSGKWIAKSHGQDDWATIRRLPAFGQATYLRYRPKRHQCKDGAGFPTTTQMLDRHDSNSPHRYPCDNHILLQLSHATIAEVGVKEGLPSSRAAGTLERRINKPVNWSELAEIGTLGLDEISLKKELPKEEYKQFDGSMRMFRKRGRDLDQQERKTLSQFFKHAPCRQASLRTARTFDGHL